MWFNLKKRNEKIRIRSIRITSRRWFGDAVDGFCIGFAAVAGGYAIGVAANVWNPVGWAGGLVGGIVGVSCAVNALT